MELGSQISDPVSVERDDSRISQLEGEISKLQERMASLREEISRDVLSRIRLQGGGTVTVSGGNGNWTITGTGPTDGKVTGTFDCTQDPPIFNGQLTF